MKILLVQESPHKKGSSNMLVEQFMEGARAMWNLVCSFIAPTVTYMKFPWILAACG